MDPGMAGSAYRGAVAQFPFEVRSATSRSDVVRVVVFLVALSASSAAMIIASANRPTPNRISVDSSLLPADLFLSSLPRLPRSLQAKAVCRVALEASASFYRTTFHCCAKKTANT